ncbi:MAG TPA: proline--tRNA ligase [Nitrospiria bacterium]
MRYSKLLIPTLREEPGEAEVVSHRLMIRAGMIRKVAAGIYTYLPLGLRVIRKVELIVREEMNRAGAQELLMPMVQPAELWNETGRWGEYGKELLRFKDRGEREFCLGPTHEEVVTDLVRAEIKSYRHLPQILYQIQTKFRDEIRPRFGLMRGREFLMKDAYSFDRDEEGAKASYDKMGRTYHRIFERCGLRFRPVEAESGVIGGTYSQEFMVLAETGEDSLGVCGSCDYAANVEKVSGNTCPSCQGRMTIHRGIEVGHIFMLGTKYSQAMKAVFLDKNGKEAHPVMGCYGIGISRTAAAAIEQNHDAKGILWPLPLAPYQVHVIPVNDQSERVMITSELIYGTLSNLGAEVLIDDRSERPGVKFNDADLIGIPYQIIVGEKNLADGLVELKERRTGKITKVTTEAVIDLVKKLVLSPATRAES